jgi:hypothetical protein
VGADEDKHLSPRACWNRIVVAGPGAAAAFRQRLEVRRAEADIVAARLKKMTGKIGKREEKREIDCPAERGAECSKNDLAIDTS